MDRMIARFRGDRGEFIPKGAVAARRAIAALRNAVLGEWVDQLVTVTTEQSFPPWGALGTIYRGWFNVINGDVAEGISLLRSGSAAYRATGQEGWMPHFIALLGGACEIAGQIEEGLTLLDEALQIADRTGERWLEAELNRHKGQLLLRQGHSNAAEELYRNALSIAQEQGAKLWELRVAESLARLRRDQSRHTEARPPRADLPLVHRRLRHPRSERSKGAARGTQCVADHAFGPHSLIGRKVRLWH
jgi:predicted ATPase